MSNSIGFVDVDGHGYPNLAIMKLAAWHKSHGDTASFANPLESYDKVYMSKVFTFTPDYPYTWDCEVEKGGTGYLDYTKVLPEEIEHTCPDYSLYGISDVAYGFTTRGCIRHCPFCLVHDKEGMIREHADLEEFLDGRKNVILMLWRKYGHSVCVYAPPYRNFSDPNQIIPQWQKDMAR